MPKESHRILIIVKSFDESVITTTSMTCTVIDRNEVYLYNKSLRMESEQEHKLEGQFIISDKATIIPVCIVTI